MMLLCIFQVTSDVRSDVEELKEYEYVERNNDNQNSAGTATACLIPSPQLCGLEQAGQWRPITIRGSLLQQSLLVRTKLGENKKSESSSAV
jgi:hypothetical protein